MKNIDIKEKTLYWLNWHLDEIHQNELSMEMSNEDKKLNAKLGKEISKCIKWVTSIKVK